jgi:predicted RND superfamily exporter protein
MKPLLISIRTRENLVHFWKAVYQFGENKAGKQPHSNKIPKNLKSYVLGLKEIEGLVSAMTKAVQEGGVKKSSPLQNFFNLNIKLGKDQNFTFLNHRIYFTLKNGKYAILLATPAKSKRGIGQVIPAVEVVQKEVKKIAPLFPEVHVHLTGEPVMGVQAMQVSKHDILFAGILALFLSASIFILGFMEWKKPFLAIISLFIGIGWSLGWIAFSVKYLNIFTISIFPMLIGLAVDFSIQFMGRYKEERTLLKSPKEAIRSTYVSTGAGLLTAAVTMALGFFAVSLTEYKGIAELGTATGGALLLCFVSTMTILPALLLLTENNKETKAIPLHLPQIGEKMEKFFLKNASYIVIGAAALSFFLGIKAQNISFDRDILHLFPHVSSVTTELKMIKIANQSSLVAVIVADNPEKAQIYVNQLEALSTVGRIISPLPFIPQNQKAKIPLLQKIKKEMLGIHAADPKPSAAINLQALIQTFEGMKNSVHKAVQMTRSAGGAFGFFSIFMFPGRYLLPGSSTVAELGKIHSGLTSFQKAISIFLKTIKTTNSPTAEKALSSFQVKFFSELNEGLQLIKNGIPNHLITLSDLPPYVKNEFISKTGQKIAIQIFPATNIWQRANLDRFVAQLRTVDPNVTGTPILIYETLRMMLMSYQHAAWIAFIVILIVTFLQFRQISLTLLTLTPLAIGLLWLLGTMVLFNSPFNPANLLTLPVILGIGVAFGVYVINRYREKGEASIFSTSTGKSVLLSALTSISGFTALLFTSSGLRSLGFTMTVGLSLVTFQALVVLPCMIHFFMGIKRARENE